MSARDDLHLVLECSGPLSTEAAGLLLDKYRAQVLREAADVALGLREFAKTTGPRKSAQVSENVGILRVADRLREMGRG